MTACTCVIEDDSPEGGVYRDMQGCPVHCAAAEPTPKHRGHYLLVSEYKMVNDWAHLVRVAFPKAVGVFLVGSVLTTKSYRDVDLRAMMWDEDFAALTALVDLHRLNLAMSLWGQRATGLPIDFQVQDMTDTNLEHPGAGRRNSIGLLT